MLCVILRSESKDGHISISNSKPSTRPQWSTTWGSCSCPKASPARRTRRRTLTLSVTSDLWDPAPLRSSTWIPTAILSTPTTICHAWTPIQAETTPKTAASLVWTAPSSGRQRGELVRQNPPTRNKEREFKKCKVKYELEIYKHTSQTVSQLSGILLNFGYNVSSQWRCGSEEGAAAAVRSVLCHVIGCRSSRHLHVSNNLPLETDNFLIGPNQRVHVHLFIVFQVCTGGKHLCLQSVSICCCSALHSSSVVVCLPARETI